METVERAVESRSAGRQRRKTPQEIEGFQSAVLRPGDPQEIEGFQSVSQRGLEGFQSVVLRPGGQVEVLNISNGGMLVQTETRTKPGSVVRVCIFTTGAKYEVKAKVVRSEITTVDGSGLHFLLAVAFDEPLDLIDDDDAATVDAPAQTPSGPQPSMGLCPPNEASIDLQLARTPNRW